MYFVLSPLTVVALFKMILIGLELRSAQYMEVKGRIGSLFDYAIVATAILTVMYGGWVIVHLDCFGANSTYCGCCAFTVDDAFELPWYNMILCALGYIWNPFCSRLKQSFSVMLWCDRHLEFSCVEYLECLRKVWLHTKIEHYNEREDYCRFDSKHGLMYVFSTYHRR